MDRIPALEDNTTVNNDKSISTKLVVKMNCRPPQVAISHVPMDCPEIQEIKYLVFEGPNMNKMGINPTVYTKRTFSPLPKSMAGIDLENKIEDFIRIFNHGNEELRLKRKEDIKTQEKDIITINENGNIRTPENGNVRTQEKDNIRIQENEMDIQMLSAEQPHSCEEALRKSNRLKNKLT